MGAAISWGLVLVAVLAVVCVLQRAWYAYQDWRALRRYGHLLTPEQRRRLGGRS